MGISFDFNEGVGPQIVNGIKSGASMAVEGAGWLSERFAEADPTTQNWIKFGMGFIGASIATRMIAGLTGMDMLRNSIVNLALSVMGGMALSGMKLGGDGPAETAPATDAIADPAATRGETDPAATRLVTPTPGGM